MTRKAPLKWAALTVVDLKSLVHCDFETGEIWWNERAASWYKGASPEKSAKSFNTRCAGKRVSSYLHTNGYPVFSVGARRYYIHRIVIALATGRWPNVVDHINGIKTDNRLANLREVSHRENCRNMRRYSVNTSGVSGVSFLENCRRWCARIGNERIGSFATKDEAIAARRDAERVLGYHTNHGLTDIERQKTQPPEQRHYAHNNNRQLSNRPDFSGSVFNLHANFTSRKGQYDHG